MNLPMFDLSGKTAVITGGATGLGYRMAEGLAQAGANIVICGRRLDRCQKACAELAEKGARTLPIQCDVSLAAEVAAMIDATIKKFGCIDILVNNAGITGGAKPIHKISESEWDNTQATNLKGVFLCSRAAATKMIAQGGGRIINIASIGATKPLPLSGDYSASKAGVVALTRTMALELIRHNIHVNAISPGYFVTDLNPVAIERVEAQAAKRIPIGRVGSADEIKGLIIFLASSASDYVVGEDIVIDGGVMHR